MTSALAVVLNGEVAGVVTHDFGRPQFAYTDDYATGSRTPLSLSLPVRAGHVYGHRITAPWLAGLLPDDARVRERWAREFDVSPQNSSALLEHLGRDCAGAVQLAPAAAIKELLTQTGHLEPVTDADIGARLRQLHTESDHWTRDQDRWSLAGAQSKFTLAATNDGWAYTHGNAPSTHIVKPGITRFPAQALNEHLCQKAFGLIGIHAAKTAYHEFDGTPAIVVQRYDRIINPDGTVVRIHQEDMCQALGVWPHKKYASDGGPSAVAIAQMLGRRATQTDVDRFTDAVVAQYLCGAPDAHAKNYSVILAGDHVALAPVYDVASVLPYNPDPRSGLARVAMPIAGHSMFRDVNLRHIEKFAVNAGTDPDRLVERTRQMAADLPAAISTAAADIPDATLGTVAEQLRDGIAEHCTTLDRPPANVRRRRTPLPEPEPEPDWQPDAEPGDDTIPVVGHSRGGHPISPHRRRRPSLSS
ncbi:type II toxin-antitoxin system HipA family toxin [Mycobacterium hubeiense]|uniref:type II toxin-antitoxin system HipA family toxin n=1 Tax=Mycobacterium hubeiense TaxID=1867256 RepID=UPI000C7EEA33|nr:type II toxin-antitoxin system HipA family toxin [Mycobacterium sp. QGD 101]